MAKPKIVILGGGVSAITVAMQLSENPQWRNRFESITIYQLGWRLGGKGATGRVGAANRILEHGLHIWLGYYENAFQLVKTIYAAAGRPASSPIPTWDKAFTGQDDVGVVDYSDGVWNPWIFQIPPNNEVPGDGKVPPLPASATRGVNWLGRTWIDLGARLADVEAVELGSRLIKLAPEAQAPVPSAELIGALKELSGTCARYRTQSHLLSLDLKAWLTLVETAATIMFGILAENISSYADLEKLEGIDFAKWLSKYSIDASIADLAVNPLLRGMYDFAFAFQNGDIGLPNFAAAPALRTIFRMCLTYKGSIFYKMNAGMGDTIFAPAYEALVKRGVGVKFFHKVKSLELSADKSRIAAVRFGRQATVTSEPYRPLKPVSVKQGLDPLPCWPDHPLYDQLANGQALSDSKANLESFWCQRPDVRETTLTVADIDKVVFGISLGSIPYLCSELLAASSAWRHLAKVATVRTQSLQLWLKDTIQQLGWKDASPVLDAWVEPFDTWADMTDILEFETWGPHRP
ncbi:MAG TPA: NAD(P)-binding protein, partial [Gemmataceae bacterium]|nr:NAD(P)-binding protein [Gemmataceae bacterium]